VCSRQENKWDSAGRSTETGRSNIANQDSERVKDNWFGERGYKKKEHALGENRLGAIRGPVGKSMVRKDVLRCTESFS